MLLAVVSQNVPRDTGLKVGAYSTRPSLKLVSLVMHTSQHLSAGGFGTYLLKLCPRQGTISVCVSFLEKHRHAVHQHVLGYLTAGSNFV